MSDAAFCKSKARVDGRSYPKHVWSPAGESNSQGAQWRTDVTDMRELQVVGTRSHTIGRPIRPSWPRSYSASQQSSGRSVPKEKCDTKCRSLTDSSQVDSEILPQSQTARQKLRTNAVGADKSSSMRERLQRTRSRIRRTYST